METVSGCTVVRPSGDAEPTRFGPTETEGAYFALVGVFPPGEPAPPPQVRTTAGGLVFVPRGVAHTVWNSGSDPVRGLIVISPGDREHVALPVETR